MARRNGRAEWRGDLKGGGQGRGGGGANGGVEETGGGMPAFEGTLSPKEIEDVSAYVVESIVGKGK